MTARIDTTANSLPDAESYREAMAAGVKALELAAKNIIINGQVASRYIELAEAAARLAQAAK